MPKLGRQIQQKMIDFLLIKHLNIYLANSNLWNI
jgi:hypothetical protein